jgi:diacylglycerol kinase (ATP)
VVGRRVNAWRRPASVRFMFATQTLQLVVLLVTLGLGVTVLMLLGPARRWSRRRRLHKRAGTGAPLAGPPKIGVVVNAAKLTDEDARRHQVDAAVAARGWQPPQWWHTTAEDPGPGQAAQARQAGCDLVLVLGGDGTVRLVAEQLLGTGIPIGLLPAGTGNLLARNLRIPPANLDQAVQVALGAGTRTMDAARAEIDISGEDHEPLRQTFLVMAGLGFDADVMAAVSSELKRKMGWFAYVLTGARNLRGRRTRVTLRLDGSEPVLMQVRSVIVGNCGELTGGVVLLPQAQLDDGWLDVVVVAPRGLVGWAAVAGRVISQRGRVPGQPRFGRPVVEHFRCRTVEVRAERPLQIQLDGDPVGSARVLRAEIEPGALRVKAP